MESVSGVWKNLKIFEEDGDNIMIFWIKSEFWIVMKNWLYKNYVNIEKRFYVFYGRVWN